MYKKSRFLAKDTAFLNSDPNRIRTYDLQIRNLLLYPAELWDLFLSSKSKVLSSKSKQTFDLRLTTADFNKQRCKDAKIC